MLKILLDTCVWGGASVELLNAGFDVKWIGDLAKDPGDKEIISIAYREKRILVTLDKDFGELAILRGFPHFGIIRIVDYSATDQGKLCKKILEKYYEVLQDGAIVTASPKRIRIRLKS